MVLAKISGSVKKLLGDDGRFQDDLIGRMKNHLAVRASSSVILQNVLKSLMGSFEAGVSSFKQRPHLRRHQGLGETVEGAFIFDLAQIQGTGRVEVNDPSVGGEGANTGLPNRVFKSNKPHRMVGSSAALDSQH